MFSALLNHIKVLRTEIRLPVATICAFKTFLKQFSSLYAETRVLRADAFRAFGVFASNHWPLHVGQSLKVMWASFHIKFKPSTYYITQIKRKIFCLMIEKQLWWRVISLKADSERLHPVPTDLRP